MPDERRPRAAVVVLGDLGRSPRMQYHALALASNLADVDLVGHEGEPPHPAVGNHPAIRTHLLPRPALAGRRRLPRQLFLLYAAWRAAAESLRLLHALLVRVERPDLVLVQNPPAVPTLVVALAAARARGARLVVDWHNFGFTMLALRVGPGHPIVRLARWIERAAGRRADAHMCVSAAMREELGRWGLRDVCVLYDRPAEVFSPTPPEARGALLARLEGALGLPDGVSLAGDPGRRAALVVCPTSWTEDEDFDLLLEAAALCDAAIRDRDARPGAQPFPHLVVLATGKGALRERFESRVAPLRKVHLRTAWLEAEDYPRLLGAADLGLCLHRSSSGLDLPMKVADMAGARLPVCALDYGPCLAERIRDGQNGVLFATPGELAARLVELVDGFPDAGALAALRRRMAGRAEPTWPEGWAVEARPLLEPLTRPRRRRVPRA